MSEAGKSNKNLGARVYIEVLSKNEDRETIAERLGGIESIGGWDKGDDNFVGRPQQAHRWVWSEQTVVHDIGAGLDSLLETVEMPFREAMPYPSDWTVAIIVAVKVRTSSDWPACDLSPGQLERLTKLDASFEIDTIVTA